MHRHHTGHGVCQLRMKGPRFREGREPGHEVLPVGVIPEEDAPLQPPHLHVAEGVRGVEAGLTGHGTGEPSTQ